MHKIAFYRKQFMSYLLSIGGKSKTNKQIAGLNDAYIAKDRIEIGFNNNIPVWMFGFMY